MSTGWGQVMIAFIFLLIPTLMRLWATRKYGKIRERVENTELQEAWDALMASSNTTFMFLIMALVWLANDALSMR